MRNKMVLILLVLGVALGFGHSASQKSKGEEGIMGYCTVADLQDTYGEEQINGWAHFDPDMMTVKRAIKNAEAEIDGYLLSGGYEIPIAGPPETIRKYCIDITAANLVLRCGVQETDPGGKAILEHAKIVRHYLGKVAEGKYKIPGFFDVAAGEIAKPPSGSVRVSARPRLDWRGY